MRSYAGTLSCVINMNIEQHIIDEYLTEIEGVIATKESYIFKLAVKLRLVSLILKFYNKYS